MFLASATLAYLASVKAADLHFPNATSNSFWIVGHGYNDASCSGEENVVFSHYHHLEACRETEVANVYERVTCWQDSNNIADDIMITFSLFDGDSKCVDIEKIVDQGSIPVEIYSGGEFSSTRCKESGVYPYLPMKFSCVQSASDKGPFSVDEPNTYSEVEFHNDECTTDFENVHDVTVIKYGVCRSVDVADLYNDNYYNGLFSMKIEDCGQNVYYYSDDNCQTQVYEESWNGEDVFTCQADDGESTQTFCPATSKAKGKGKKAPREYTFASEISLAIDSARASAFSQKTQTEATSPMRVAVLGSVVGMAIGMVAAVKFFKSRTQFEGVEMRSSHSSFE